MAREMLESILKDEEGHIDWIEAQLDQIGTDEHPDIPGGAIERQGSESPGI